MRSASFTALLGALALAGACQLAARDDRRSPAALPPVAPAPPRIVVVSPAPAVPALAPVEAPAPAPAAGVEPPAKDCPDPPEKLAAQAGMARMKQEYDTLSASLSDLLAEYLTTVRQALAGSGDLDPVVAAARDSARRAGAVPGWHPVAPEALSAAAGNALFVAAVCRAVDGDPADCRRLDAVEAHGSARCDRVSRLLLAWRLLRAGRSPDETQAALSSPEESARLAALRAAVVDGDAARCGRTRGSENDDWAILLCRGLAARELAPCDGVADPGRRAACRALIHAQFPQAGPADTLGVVFRRWVENPGAAPDCVNDALAVLEKDPAVADAFRPAPFALPEAEFRRGVAPSGAVPAPPGANLP